MDDQLYDKVHAVVTNWLVGALTGGESRDETRRVRQYYCAGFMVNYG